MIDRNVKPPTDEERGESFYFEDQDGSRWELRPANAIDRWTFYEVLDTSEREVGTVRVEQGSRGRLTLHVKRKVDRIEAVFTKQGDAIRYLIGKSGGGD